MDEIVATAQRLEISAEELQVELDIHSEEGKSARAPKKKKTRDKMTRAREQRKQKSKIKVEEAEAPEEVIESESVIKVE
jgi:hypothetical protein